MISGLLKGALVEPILFLRAVGALWHDLAANDRLLVTAPAHFDDSNADF